MGNSTFVALPCPTARLGVDALVVNVDREDAVVAGLQRDAGQLLAEAFEDGLLDVEGARQVTAGDAVLDVDGGAGHGGEVPSVSLLIG